MDEQAKLAYLGGFFDGEGSVYILRKSSRGGVQYSLEASLCGSDPAPIVMAQEVLGGTITVLHNGRYKPIHRLRIRCNQATTALTKLLPFLIVKRERALIGIEFQSVLSANWGQRSRSISVEDCEALKSKLSALNDKVSNRIAVA